MGDLESEPIHLLEDDLVAVRVEEASGPRLLVRGAPQLEPALPPAAKEDEVASLGVVADAAVLARRGGGARGPLAYGRGGRFAPKKKIMRSRVYAVYLSRKTIIWRHNSYFWCPPRGAPKVYAVSIGKKFMRSDPAPCPLVRHARGSHAIVLSPGAKRELTAQARGGANEHQGPIGLPHGPEPRS